MIRTLALVKKDIIINRNLMIGMILASFIIPVFVQSKMGGHGMDFISFFVSTFLIEYIIFGSSSMLDYKYKGAALLSTTPYKRTSIVRAGYLFIIACFFGCYAIYSLVSLIPHTNLPKLGILTIGEILLGVVSFFSIVIPLQYYFGYEKMKMITYLFVFLVPFGLPSITKWLQDRQISFHFITELSTLVKCILIYGAGMVILYLSIIISIKIYQTKDL